MQKLRLLIERSSFGSVPDTGIPKLNSLLLSSFFVINRRIKGIICFKVIPDLINPILSNDVFGIYKKGYLIIKRSYYYWTNIFFAITIIEGYSPSIMYHSPLKLLKVKMWLNQMKWTFRKSFSKFRILRNKLYILKICTWISKIYTDNLCKCSKVFSKSSFH